MVLRKKEKLRLSKSALICDCNNIVDLDLRLVFIAVRHQLMHPAEKRWGEI